MNAQMSRELFLISLMNYIRLPYIWGGSGPSGYDCSGLVEAALKSLGVKFTERLNSQMLYNQYIESDESISDITNADLGDLAFFGEDAGSIKHVGLCLGYGMMIEAAHGDHTCTTAEIALARGASVMVNPISHRKDLVGIVKISLDWLPTSSPS